MPVSVSYALRKGFHVMGFVNAVVRLYSLHQNYVEVEIEVFENTY